MLDPIQAKQLYIKVWDSLAKECGFSKNTKKPSHDVISTLKRNRPLLDTKPTKPKKTNTSV
jgi:hypothetical protein